MAEKVESLYDRDSLLSEYIHAMTNLGQHRAKQAGMYDLGEVRKSFPDWPADSKYPPDLADAWYEGNYDGPGLLGVTMSAASKPWLAKQIVGKPMEYTAKKIGKRKAASKILTKIGSRFVPGAGWVLGAADLIDYFGYPIYDHLPESVGNFMTWRDTTEGEEE